MHKLMKCFWRLVNYDRTINKKFENDVEKRTRFMRFILVLDQALNVIFWNGSQDETVSSHIGRRIERGDATWFDKKLCCFLKRLENNHCNKSLGE